MNLVSGFVLAVSLFAGSNAYAASSVTADEFLTVSGLKASFDKLPGEIAGGIFSNIPASIPESAKKALIKGYDEAYPPGIITMAVSKALQSGGDMARLPHLVEIVSSPVSKKMTALELKEPRPEEMKAFVATLSSKPPGKDRLALLKELVDETHSVEIISKLAEVTGESYVLATSSGCADDIKRIRDGFSKARPTIKQSVYQNAMLSMAFTYRTATDDELREYIKTYRDPDAKAVYLKLSKVAVNEYLARWKVLEKTIMRLGSDLTGESMFAKSCRRPVPEKPQKVAQAVASEKALSPAPVRTKSPLSGNDARECLELGDAAKIATCAERYR